MDNGFTVIPVARNDFAAQLPERAHEDDAAFDLRAAQNARLRPGYTAVVSTGLTVAIPEGFAGLVLPRSGLAAKEGLTVANAPGLIDPGFRGTVGVVLYLQPRFEDFSDAANGCRPTRTFEVKKGDRIAQLLIVRLPLATFQSYTRENYQALRSERGEGGFGSTGVA